MTFNYRRIKAFAICVLMLTATVTMSGCGIFFDMLMSIDDTEQNSAPVYPTGEPATATPKKDRAPVETSYGFESLSEKSLEELYYFIDDYVVNNRLSVESRIEGLYTEKQIFEALTAYKDDHPEKFWLKNNFAYYHKNNDDGNNETRINFFYIMSLNELDKAKEVFNAKLKGILSKAPKNATDFELEKYVNDYLVKNCKYDREAAKSDVVLGNANDAYGAIVEGKAVCEGYARAFQLICNRLGLDCVSVVGESDGEGHQWNSVKIEDDWYCIDVTWNDDDDDTEYNNYNYFNITSKQLAETHKTATLFKDLTDEEYEEGLYYNTFVPKCTSDEYNYYKHTCLTVDNIYNSEDVKESIAKSAVDGEKYYQFIIGDSLDFDTTVDELVNDGYIYEWIEGANYINGYNPELNPSVYVYQNEMHNVLIIELDYV